MFVVFYTFWLYHRMCYKHLLCDILLLLPMSLLHVSTVRMHKLACKFNVSLVKYRQEKMNILKTDTLVTLTQIPIFNAMNDTNTYVWQEFIHYEMTLMSLCIHTWYQVHALHNLVCYMWTCKLHTTSNLSFYIQCPIKIPFMKKLRADWI
jgi:hypothetical protein